MIFQIKLIILIMVNLEFFRYFLGDGEENNQENLSEEEIAKFSNQNITLPNNSSKRFELIEVLETKLNYLNGQQINETILNY